MSRRILSLLSLLILLTSSLTVTVQAGLDEPQQQPFALVYVSLSTRDALARFEETGLPAYVRLQGCPGERPRGGCPYVISGADPAGLEALAAAGLNYRILDPDISDILERQTSERLFIAQPKPGRPQPDWGRYGKLLHDDGFQALLRTSPAHAELLAESGVELQALNLSPKPLQPALFPPIPDLLEPDPLIQFLMDQVFTTTVYQYTGDLSGEWPVDIGGLPYTIVTRHTQSGEPIQKATQFVGQQLQNLGLDVEYHVWEGDTYPNVIGELPGLVNPDDIYIICAHLDNMPPGPIAPGADDNASGSVAVLIAADLLTQFEWGCTLRFALWTGEEQGLEGSMAYAERAFQNGENILGVVNLDMIGWNTLNSSPDMDIECTSDLTPTIEMAELYADVISTYNLDLIPEIQYSGCCSDHVAFWLYGFHAVGGFEDNNDFNPYYHTTEDLLEYLDVDYYTQQVKAAIGTFAHLSGCLLPGGVGYLDGHVTEASGGAPISGATLRIEDPAGHTFPATTDPSGYYTRTLVDGVYTVTVSAYGYTTDTVGGVIILTDTVTTQDFAMATAPTHTISGTVSEEGTGLPLEAEIAFLGSPVVVSTDPATGFYQAALAEGSYTMRVRADRHRSEERKIQVYKDQNQDFVLERLPCILLVDDDQNSPDVHHYYTEALDSLAYSYDLWSIESSGDPLPEDLIGYPMVLWFGGFPWLDTFNRDNELAVGAYLEAGGNFFLSSEDYLYDRGITNFAQNYLGIESHSDSLRDDPVGNPGDPIGDGLGPYALTLPPGWPWFYTDNVTGVQGSPFSWAGSGLDNSTRYEGDNFKSIFLSWPPEGLADLGDRRDVLGAAIDWFGGCTIEPGRLAGQVTDAQGGAPLEGARLTAMPGSYQATTDASGHYSLTLPGGLYTVTAELEGYIPQAVTGVTIPTGVTVTLDLALVQSCQPVTATDVAWTPLTPTAGQVVTFTASASGTEPISYNWNLGNSNFESGNPITHVYTMTGDYPVTLTATNCGTATDSVVHTVTVVPACEPVTGADLTWIPVDPSVGQAITFTGQASGTLPLTYTWSLGDGTTEQGSVISHSYDLPGTYTVMLTVTNPCDQVTASDIVTIAALWEVYLPIIAK